MLGQRIQGVYMNLAMWAHADSSPRICPLHHCRSCTFSFIYEVCCQSPKLVSMRANTVFCDLKGAYPVVALDKYLINRCMDRLLKYFELSFPGGSDSKASARKTGDLSSIPWSGRSPGEGNGNPLQYSCLENPMDRGAWWAAVHGVVKSRA